MISRAGPDRHIVRLRVVCWGLTLVVLLMWAYAVLFLFPHTLLDVLYDVMMPLVFFALAILLYLRRSSDAQALTSGLMLVFLGPFLVGGVSSQFEVLPGWGLITLALEWIALGLVMHFLLTFPSGQYVPRSVRWLPFLLPGVTAVAYVTLGQARALESGIMIYIFLAGVLFGMGAQIYRYMRVSDSVARQQAKWVSLGFAGPVLTIALWFFVLQRLNLSSNTETSGIALAAGAIAILLPLTLPVGITVSILRYRLWEIDFIIRRTVTYALVTGVLVVIYFGTVIALQQIFALVTGGSPSELVTVVSTLVIAALFVPVRRRIQDAIDRRFNRNKYDAGQILEDFARTVRDETDLEQLTARLMHVVDETMQPTSISVWLKQDRKQ